MTLCITLAPFGVVDMEEFRGAEIFANALSKLMDTPGRGQRTVYDGYSRNTYRPEFSEMIMHPEAYGAPQGYDPRMLGNMLNMPLWGGVKMPVPMTGAGYEQGGWMKENGMGASPEENYLKADPFQQMVYGMLIRMGYPVLGPSYKDHMNEIYGPGSEGIVGFGER